MPEYHKLKGSTPSLTFFKTPEMAAQATLDAQRILGVDAAILFADLLPIIEPMGFELDYVAGVGPVIGNRIESNNDVSQIPSVCAEESFPYIPKAIGFIKRDLPAGVPLIGFAGAPFTLASYLIEGGSSRDFLRTKKFMYHHEQAWQTLVSKLTETLIGYLRLQIEAKVDVLQIFDSWVGCLSKADYRRYVLPYVKQLMNAVNSDVPVIYFGTGNSHLCDDMARSGASLLALDWRTALKETWLQSGLPAVQGNLDPAVLLADREVIERESNRLLHDVNGAPGHIFNLGHGIQPTTPVDNVKLLVDFVHEASATSRSN